MRKIIQSHGAPAPIGPYSQAVMHNNVLFISMQIAIDPESGLLIEKGMKEMTVRIMENIGNILKEAEMGYEDITMTSLYLADIHDFAEVNEVYGSYFTGNFPARETMQIACLPKNARLAISAVAMKA